MIEDEQGDIWASMAQGGVYKININGGRPRNFQAEDGLGHNNFWATYEASDEKVWIGTHEGIDVYDPKSQTVSILAQNKG